MKLALERDSVLERRRKLCHCRPLFAKPVDFSAKLGHTIGEAYFGMQTEPVI